MCEPGGPSAWAGREVSPGTAGGEADDEGCDTRRAAKVWLTLALALGAFWPAVAGAADSVAVLTEIPPGKARFESNGGRRDSPRPGRSRPSAPATRFA